MDEAIEKRKHVARQYREALKDVIGISCLQDIPGVRHNYSYFPIFVNEAKYGMSRDELYEKLKENNIYGRRYFYPLISEFATYRGLDSSKKENLPVSHKIADNVICLPMHHEISEENQRRIIELISKK